MQLKIFNALVKLVYDNPLLKNPVLINRRNLETGIYFYQVVRTDGDVASGKFMID